MYQFDDKTRRQFLQQALVSDLLDGPDALRGAGHAPATKPTAAPSSVEPLDPVSGV